MFPPLLLLLSCLRGKPLLTVQFLSLQTFLYTHTKQLFKNGPTTSFFYVLKTYSLFHRSPLHFKKDATQFIYRCAKTYFAILLLMDIYNVSNHLCNCLYVCAVSLGWKWNCMTNGMCTLTLGQMLQNCHLFRRF